MKEGVLFVCYGNSCRSIMAEALANHYWGESLRAASAGISPLGHVTAHTLQVLGELNVCLEALHSKGLGDIDIEMFQLIVNLMRTPVEDFMPSHFSGEIIHWPVHDPYGEGLPAFRQARDAIAVLVKEKLPLWLKPGLGREP